jgi:hypothetical protein
MHDRFEANEEAQLEFNPDFYDPQVFVLSALIRHSLDKDMTEFPIEDHLPR